MISSRPYRDPGREPEVKKAGQVDPPEETAREGGGVQYIERPARRSKPVVDEEPDVPTRVRSGRFTTGSA